MQVCLFLAHIHVKLDQITASNQPSALECVLHMQTPFNLYTSTSYEMSHAKHCTVIKILICQ